ncbi:MAG: spermine synthase [Armatimonadetes bacterium]|nr:spermine synthase [Armatimonadota bacterium]
MTALSVGYYWGGRIADRYPSHGLFCGIVFLAGLLIVPIPLVAPAVLEMLNVRDVGPRTGPLAASLTLFIPASVVMGMVSPLSVRLAARSFATVGAAAGRLYAISTMGSITGCLLASFYLISILGVREIILMLGVAEMAMASVGFLALRRAPVAAAAAAVATLIVVLVAPRLFAAERPGVIFAKDTVYHRITISDEGHIRYMRLDNYWQSAENREDRRRTVFRYADYMHAGMLFAPDARKVLLIGMGGGTVPKRFLEDYPNVEMTVVEIDPDVNRAAERFFDVPSSGRIRTFGQDGRQFVRRSPDRYGQILMDAYLKDTLPFHLATREYFQEIRDRLTPEGVFVANIIGALDGPESKLFRAVFKSVQHVFPNTYAFPVEFGDNGYADSIRNIIVVGTQGAPTTRAEVIRRAAMLRDRVRVPGFDAVSRDFYTRRIRTEDVPVLTDNYAPSDWLIHSR